MSWNVCQNRRLRLKGDANEREELWHPFFVEPIWAISGYELFC